ncbi:succinyl-CoA synthetase alpha subunit [Parabacteroides chinchillae]|uniref:Succinyl-CoA synthetase alpha subunit n=1 Tax=Parabacteroides chinchillae TaxID=871327 RepID=A0A8G2F0B9_9BACT|nr:succinyl-CoA synthetase alpha subunit [Parabacteroides chinchillae]
MLQNDPQTETIAMIDETGGNAEELAAQYIRDSVTKPVVAFIAGQSAPPGKQMGHAGAIISGGSGSATEKIATLQVAGIKIANEPSEIPALLKAGLHQKSTR